MGSRPIARSQMPKGIFYFATTLLTKRLAPTIMGCAMATWPSGKARVCKTLITGSNPVVASKKRQALLSFYFFLF